MSARFMNSLPTSVVERFEAEQGHKTAGGPRTFHPAVNGGKYHLSDPTTGQAYCSATTLVDRSQTPMPIVVGQQKVNPIVCQHCLKYDSRGQRIE